MTMVYSPSAPLLEHHLGGDTEMSFDAPVALPMAAVETACVASAGLGDAPNNFTRLRVVLNKEKASQIWGLRLMAPELVDLVRFAQGPTRDVTEEYLQAIRPVMDTFPNAVPVMFVDKDTPASKAGLRRLDVVVAVNDHPISSLADYRAVAGRIKAADRHLVLDIMREEEPAFLFREIRCPYDVPHFVKCYEVVMTRAAGAPWGFTPCPFAVKEINRDVSVTCENPEYLEMANMKGGLGIDAVTDFTPAAEAGLQRYDVIIEVNGRWCSTELSSGMKRGGTKQSEMELTRAQIVGLIKKADERLRLLVLRSIRPLPDPRPDTDILKTVGDSVGAVASKVGSVLRRKSND